MKRGFRLLVFDWDGTLMDSTTAIAQALQSACRDLGLPVPSDQAARHVIGLGLSDALRIAAPSLQPQDQAPLLERYRVHWRAHDAATVLFPGVREGLAALREAGFLLAVATGKSRRGLDRALEGTGLASLFHGTRCADEGFSKPHPGMLEHLIDECGVDRRETLMIGDTTHDLAMASNAGTAALACAYGAHPRPELERHAPLAVLASFVEVRAWIERHA